METKDTANNRVRDFGCEPSGGDLLSGNSDSREGENEKMLDNKNNNQNEDNQLYLASNFDEDMDISSPTSQVSVKLIETVAITETVTCLSSEMHAENGIAPAAEGNSLSNHKEDEAFASSQENDPTALSGAKRSRTTSDKQQPSVHVTYNSLPRESRQKLEELLQQWSQYHARHASSSNDSSEALESGEEIYFPALQIGLDKASAVTCWMDNQTKNPANKEIMALDGKSVPLYDRGYSLALASTEGSGNLERGFEELHASRCFNCGSYSHPLKDCPKPRDNVAVNSARKQHNSKRNQSASSRNSTRYYQNTPKGKFDGSRPGVLNAETRQLLGLGELDPPPWLNRMREIGYPPGYLDPEDEDQPSGITIFADEESKEEKEEETVLGAGQPEPPRKMSVEIPGMNAPIPENANRRHWEAGSSSFNPSRYHPYRRYDHPSESISRGHYLSTDNQDDQRPGFDPRLSPFLSMYPDRYHGGEFNYNSHSPYGSPSPSFGRYFPETGRRSPLAHYDYSNFGLYGSLP